MGMMRLLCVGGLLVALMFYMLTYVEGMYDYAAYATAGVVSGRYDAYVTPKYDRIEEVRSEKACEDVIDSASELGSNDNRASSIKYDLSFAGGEWDQKPGSVTTRPLLPFVDYNHRYSNMSYRRSSAKLSWFRITDVNNDQRQRSKKTVSVNGVLDMIITRNGPMPEMGSREPAPQFQMWRAHTQVSVFFQGVYTESEKNGGERVMCLLGNAMLTDRQSDSAHPRGHRNLSDPMIFNPPLLQDDRILLVLHYPMKFTLTQRAVQGKMRSLRLEKDLNYFDEVQISSQLSREYEFGSQAVKKACPYSDNLLDGDIDVYKGTDFCSLFEEVVGHLDIMPNWRCNGNAEFCSKLGPFVTNDKEIKGTHGALKNAGLLTRIVLCEQTRVNNNISVARVSLVLRAALGHRSYYYERMRNGLGNMTLAAEGVWNSSNGQLCMVSCLGIVDAEGSACDSRVCFYIPTTFSINQRSALVGSISSLNVKTPSYFPLSFHVPIHSGMMWEYNMYTNLRYKYSKIGLARAILDKDEPSSFGIIKKSLLKFPRMQENEDYNSSLSLLAEDLTFHVEAVPHSSPSSWIQHFVSMRILTVDSVFSSYSRGGNYSFTRARTPYHEKAEYTMKQLLVKVSAQLSISGMDSSNLSSLSVEGLYDPLAGKMYLIGCRDVRTSSKILLERKDLDGGFDCSTEVVISYPSITAQWLLNPGARISITSKRQQNDTLYFKPVTLKTFPITYRRQREDALSEKAIEGVLRVLTLSVAVACIVLQLLYIRRAADSVPYVSLVMLGIQALGYSVPLITGVESLFKGKHTESYHMNRFVRLSNELENGQSSRAVGSMVKILILVAFLLTLRLLQKVWKSRVRLLRRAQHEPGRAPNDKLPLLVTSVIHVAGLICVLYVRASNTSQEAPSGIFMGESGPVEISSSSGAPRQWNWMVVLEEYMGLVQDLFLLPQVVGNLLWQVDCKPLRKLYYIGISIVRLLPHVYDYFKSSTLNPYFAEDYVFVERNTDFYSKFSDVFIPVMIVLLAVLVYVQQRWSYNKLSDAFVIRGCRLLPLRRNVYQKLPSQSIEAELSSSGDGTGIPDQEA